jgi:pimeloyl-ACP methyl ester carboxylesterase
MKTPNIFTHASSNQAITISQILISKLIILLILVTGLFLSSCNKEEDVQPVPATGDITSGQRKATEELVTVNGYNLFVKTEGNKKPSVVFISGLAESLQTWKEVQPKVATFSQTFAYDRAGIGGSDAVTGSRTSLDVAKELHGVLINAKIKAPYILVAHSIGGLHARMFADLYPTEVAGIVLVDVLHEEQLLAIKNIVPEGFTLDQLLEMIAESDGMNGGGKAEFLASVNSAEQVKQTHLPQVPLAVLTAMIPSEKDTPESMEWKRVLHSLLAAQVPGSKHILAEQSGHHIQIDQPELVINAIQEMSKKVK